MEKFKRVSPTDIEMEKEVLTGMITDGQYLKEIEPLYSPEVFKIPFSRTVAKWCLDYFKQYSDAPGGIIEELYADYMNGKRADETQVEMIGKFLENLSEAHAKKKNVKYMANKAERYFRKRQIELHRDSLTALLLQEKIEEAENASATFKRIARPESIGVDILRDNISPYIYNEGDALFQFPGALGDMIDPFYREDFVGIAAPMKRGKTFWLVEIGLKALARGFNVIFYSFEMSYPKMIKRIYQHFIGLPKKRQVVRIPSFTRDGVIDYKDVEKRAFSGDVVRKKKKQLQNLFGDGTFRLVCLPTGSLNVEGLKRHLDNLEYYEGFVPDIIIPDYADIMAPEPRSSTEERHRLNSTWMALRGMAQEKKALVVTGTQLSKATFSRDAGQEDIAEDIRKLAHVTHMLALNQDKEDKRNQIMRISSLGIRDAEFHIGDEICVLECKAIGRPFIDARWGDQVKIKKN